MTMLVLLVKKVSLAVYYSVDLAKEMLVMGVLGRRPTQAIMMLAVLVSMKTTDPF